MTVHAVKGTEEKCLSAGTAPYAPMDERQAGATLTRPIQTVPRQGRTQPTARLDAVYNAWEGMPEQMPEINLHQALKLTRGNTGMLNMILKDLRKSFSDVEERLNRHLDHGAPERARRLVHTIRGISGNLGADALYTAAGILELRLTSETGHGLRPAMDAFLKRLRRFSAALEGFNLDPPRDSAIHSEPDRPNDIEAVAGLIADMRHLLKRSDSRVRHVLPELLTLIRGPVLDAEARQLERAICNLDSDKALACLSAIAAKLEIAIQEVEA